MNDEVTKTEVPEEVTAVLVQEKIDPQSSKSLIAKFAPYHAQINDTLAESRNITDPEKPTAQKLARTCRLELRRIRCEIENVRKDAKTDALRYGKAVDGMSNVFKLLIEPEEERLDQIEKHAEIKERARIAALVEDRTAKLWAVDADPSAYNLGAMDDATFDGVLAMAEKIKADRIEAERKAEEECVAREKAEAEERERMRAENERLKAEAEAREKLERAAAEEKRKADEAKRKADQEDAERVRKESDEKHKRGVMNKAYQDLVSGNIDPDIARAVVKLVASGSVSGMRMAW